MQPAVPWYVLAIAGLTWLLGLPFALRQGRGVWRTLILGGLLAAAGYAATLGVASPFHRGQGLGCGFAFGALAATLAALPALQAGSASAAGRILAVAAMVAPSLAAATLVYMLLPSVRVDALAGTFIGWAIVAVLLRRTTGPATSSAATADWQSATTVFTGVFCLLLILTVHRARELAVGYHWATLVLTFAAAGLLALVVAAPLAGRVRHAAATVAGTVATLVTGVIGAQLVQRMAVWLRIEDAAHDLALTVLAGCAGGFVLGAFVTVRRAAPAHWELGLAALIGIAIAAPGLHLMVGTGAGLALLAAMFPLLATVATDSEAAGAPEQARRATSATLLASAAILPVLSLLAVRVLAERFGSALSRPGLTDHFQVASLVLGAVLPAVVTGIGARRPSLASAGVAAMLSVVWPLALAVLWGPTIVAPLAVGLGLSALVACAESSIAVASVSLAALVQLAPVAVHMSSLTRTERAQLLLVAGAACVAACLCSLGAGALRRTQES